MKDNQFSDIPEEHCIATFDKPKLSADVLSGKTVGGGENKKQFQHILYTVYENSNEKEEAASKATLGIIEYKGNLENTRNKVQLVSESHGETLEIVEQIEMEATVYNKIE